SKPHDQEIQDEPADLGVIHGVVALIRQQNVIEHAADEEATEDRAVAGDQDLELAAMLSRHIEEAREPEADHRASERDENSLGEQYERAGFDDGTVSSFRHAVFVID